MKVYGIGNPLIDILADGVSDLEIKNLGVHKGIMQLINLDQRKNLVEFLQNRKYKYSCGGSCPNTMVTLAALGVETTLAGRVGNDEFGRKYKAQLLSEGVKDELVFCDEPTGSSIILVSEDSERTMNTYLGANRYFSEEDIVESSIKDADYFHFTGYMWDTPSQKASVRKALKLAHENNVKVSFDVADPFAVSRYRQEFLELIENECDIVFANNEEARLLFDHYDPKNCCKSLGKLCKTAVVKNGKKGSYVSYEREIQNIALCGPATAVDTTGAGDNYAAGFLYGQCQGYDVVRSGQIASYLAGEIIKNLGAQFTHEQILHIKENL